MSESKTYGWFSDAYCCRVPHTLHVYLRPDRSRVTVCGAQSSEGPPDCGFQDAVMVGEVTQYMYSYESRMLPYDYMNRVNLALSQIEKATL